MSGINQYGSNRKSLLTRAVLTLSLVSPVLAFNHAGASELCNSVAPGLQENPSDYYEIKNLSETAVDASVQELMAELVGDWQGHSFETSCHGRAPHSTPAIDQFDIEAEISQDWRGDIKLEAEKHHIDDSMWKLERLTLTPMIDSGDRWKTDDFSQQVLDIGSSSIALRHKYRAQNGGFAGRSCQTAEGLIRVEDSDALCRRTTRLIDEIKRVKWTQASLTIERDTYVNGVFVARQGWDLQRIR